MRSRETIRVERMEENAALRRQVGEPEQKNHAGITEADQ